MQGRVQKAMILAAGFGERARPLSLIRPKPLFPLLNRPLIEWTLELLSQAGVVDVVVNTHHLADRVEHFLTRCQTSMAIRTIHEPTILGTGGGVKNAVRHWDEPFVLINADIFIRLNLKDVVADHLRRGALATLVLHHHPEFNQVWADREGNIRGFRGEVPTGGDSGDLRKLAFTGVHVVDPAVLPRMPEGPGDIIDVYQSIIRDGGRIRAFVADGLPWWDAGTLSRYLGLHGDLMRESRERLAAAPGAVVGRGADIQGWACLGENAVIESGATVCNSVLWPGARVASGVYVANSVVADGAVARRDVQGQAVVSDHVPAKASAGRFR